MSKDVNTVLYSCIGVVFLIIVIIVGGTLLSGWALSIMWAWYVVPVFGLPILSIKNSILLASIIGYFTPTKIDDENKSKNEKLLSSLGVLIFKPVFYVFWFWFIINWF